MPHSPQASYPGTKKFTKIEIKEIENTEVKTPPPPPPRQKSPAVVININTMQIKSFFSFHSI